MSTNPSESDLTEALTFLKTRDPKLGISKVHALLLETHPKWVVSEKRTRKVLQGLGLVVSSSANTDSANRNTEQTTPSNGSIAKLKGTDEPPVFPTSRVIETLDLYEWSQKIAVKYFDKKKGKGLVALHDFKENEIMWREDPFIVAPEWEIYDMQMTSMACGYCTTPLNLDSPLIIACASSSSNSRSPPIACTARFCNRLCSARSSKVHPLLCPSQNPASIPILKFAREHEWMALHALIHSTARILLVNQHNESALKADWDILSGMAELGMEERFKWSFQEGGAPEPDRSTWKKAYTLYIQAFKEPKSPQEQKKLGKLLKKPIPDNIDTALFDYQTGWLRGLGRMSLNLEAHGGLYAVHSHLNHSCDPNVSIRHLDQRTALARLTVVARRPIKPGEELLITYVNPQLGYRARQRELRAWGFGKCTCARCVDEERMSKDAGAEEELDDMASELKAGLGIM